MNKSPKLSPLIDLLARKLREGDIGKVLNHFFKLEPEQRSVEIVDIACTAAYLGPPDPSIATEVSAALNSDSSESTMIVYLWFLLGSEDWSSAARLGITQSWDEFESQALAAIAVSSVMLKEYNEAQTASSRAVNIRESDISLFSRILVEYTIFPTKDTAAKLLRLYGDSESVLIRDTLLRLACYHRYYDDLRNLLKHESPGSARLYVLFGRFMLSRAERIDNDSEYYYELLNDGRQIQDIAIHYSFGIYKCLSKSYGVAVQHFSKVLVEVESDDRVHGKSEYYAWFSHACVKSWRMKDALRYANSALQLDQSNVMALGSKGRACFLTLRFKCFFRCFATLFNMRNRIQDRSPR